MSDEKKNASRIYRVHDKKTGDVSFCRANTAASAVNYVTRDRLNVRVAATDDVLGVPRTEIMDATLSPPIHPDQAPLQLPAKAD